MIIPTAINGGSTGLAPIHVNIKNSLTSVQNDIFFIGANFLFNLFFFKHNVASTSTEHTMATTPPSFDGIDRRIAYANKKYHSGWMWGGVVEILALLKFSTSPKLFGSFEISAIMATVVTTSGIVSFTRKYGKNFILS